MFDRKFSDADLDKFINKCRSLPMNDSSPFEFDYVENLLNTVLDFQMNGTTVKRAMNYFQQHAHVQIADYAALKNLLDSAPDTQAGNLQVAEYLFGYKLWTRVELLRRLLAYFQARGVTTQEQLEQWAAGVDFQRDFKGQVKGAGFVVFQWLVIRQGVETASPDTRIHRFIQDALGYTVRDDVAVELMQAAALELGMKTQDLDWRIWEYQKKHG